MAIEAHLAEFKKGAESWNQWREQNPQLAPDLQQAELNGATLGLNGKQPFDLSGCDLTDAKLSNFEFTAALSDLKFFKARLTKVIFHGSLQRVDFRRSRLDKVSFEDVAFAQSPLAGCKAKACHFQRARFEVTEQDKKRPDQELITTLESAVFEHCDFRDAKFDGVTLRSARFEHCDLRGVEGLVVDDNVLRGTLMSPKATDAWSQMRRTYTGANMVFILLASVIFFLPWLAQSGFWVGVNRVEARVALLVDVMPLAPEVRAVFDQLPEGRSARGVVQCLAGEPVKYGHCIPTWQLVLGWHEGWPAAIVSTLLLLYNVLRLGLTFLIAPLRDVERQSFHTPTFKPVAGGPAGGLGGWKGSYGWLVPLHKVAKWLMLLAVSAGVLNLVVRLSAPVWLPGM